MWTPTRNWSEPVVTAWVQAQLLRGKSKEAVVGWLMRGGWTRASGSALIESVEEDLNARVELRRGLIDRVIDSIDRVPNPIDRLVNSRFVVKIMCGIGSHRGDWQYLFPKTCEQLLGGCSRCGAKARRTRHTWSDWQDAHWWSTREAYRVCHRCSEREVRETGHYYG